MHLSATQAYRLRFRSSPYAPIEAQAWRSHDIAAPSLAALERSGRPRRRPARGGRLVRGLQPQPRADPVPRGPDRPGHRAARRRVADRGRASNRRAAGGRDAGPPAARPRLVDLAGRQRGGAADLRLRRRAGRGAGVRQRAAGAGPRRASRRGRRPLRGELHHGHRADPAVRGLLRRRGRRAWQPAQRARGAGHRGPGRGPRGAGQRRADPGRPDRARPRPARGRRAHGGATSRARSSRPPWSRRWARRSTAISPFPSRSRGASRTPAMSPPCGCPATGEPSAWGRSARSP